MTLVPDPDDVLELFLGFWISRTVMAAVAFSVAMIVNTAGGDAHTPSQYRAWLEAAGLTGVTETPIPGRIVTAAFEATKP